MLIRMRRNRIGNWIRELIAESSISVNDLVYPVFLEDGTGLRSEIKTMPGIFRLSIDELIKEAKLAESLGINAIALFPNTNQKLKNAIGSEAYNPDNLACRAVKFLKDAGLNIGIICDAALDPYTSHGHDGILDKNGIVDNDLTIDALIKQSLVLVNAGADSIAPSDMMDGRISAIRLALEQEGFKNKHILAYSAKYASSFYGPFREAIGSSANLKSGSKATYQMDKRNIKEAMREIELDIKEGADAVMIKPGMPYLDIIKLAASRFDIPIFAYQVSGEYAMMKYASLASALDFDSVMLESLISFKRAGASGIFSYASIHIAKVLNNA